ncbi:MAG: hypothetical protein KKF56_05130 [Nanoarchaeota archaeon]|nr:hypothetical protein [Nanoarchaeota archaeon]
MCKFNPKNNSRRIDPCMKNFVKRLNVIFDKLKKHKEGDFRILACCCGHGKYPMTIVCSYNNEDIGKTIIEFISGKGLYKKSRKNALIINTEFRKKKFYKKDKQGYYYIPESLIVKGEGGGNIEGVGEGVMVEEIDS